MLVDLEATKRALRWDDDNNDAEIMEIIEDASMVIIKYLKLPEGTYETTAGAPDDVPRDVKRATLLVVKNICDHPEIDPIDEAVVSLLKRSRDPAIA